MNNFKDKHLRPGRKITDQFIIASLLSILISVASAIIIPTGFIPDRLFNVFFEGGNTDAAAFLKLYFNFISIWIVLFLIILIFKGNRPMLRAVKYCSPRVQKDAGGINGRKKNRAGNNIRGLLIGLALGFACNGSCVLLSVLLGDIHLEFNGFKVLPFIAFLICVFIQSAAEELTDRWYLYQKLRRRYKAKWIAIVINSFVFMALHFSNPGISLLPLIQILVVGLLFSLFVYYYNGLWIAAAFHAAWNFTQSIFFGLPNSGIVSAYSVFTLDTASATDGPFYNVHFGVEGSIGAILLLTALGVFLVLINRGREEHTDVWAEADEAAIEKSNI